MFKGFVDLYERNFRLRVETLSLHYYNNYIRYFNLINWCVSDLIKSIVIKQNILIDF